MTLLGKATRLTVIVGDADQWHHRPLYAEIVRRARDAGIGGASVFRGIEGFGKSSRVHTTRMLSLSEDLPISIVMVSSDDRIRAFLPEVEQMVDGGIVMIDEVEVIKYAPHGEPAGDAR